MIRVPATAKRTPTRSARNYRLKARTILAAGALGVLVLALWLGLKIQPAPFASYPTTGVSLAYHPLPTGLPAPVERYYRVLYGDAFPVVTSAVISGRATLKPVAGIPMPARFRFIHEAGRNYRHYIEVTLFGIPFLKINEYYLDGNARMELPFGITENEPQLDQGANLALWSESIWLPSVFLTDPRISWHEVDDNTAILRVPFESMYEHFVVRFDPDTGLVRFFESMRYPGADSEQKELWINEVLRWDTLGTHLFPVDATVTWLYQGEPWAVFTVEEIVYNANISEYIGRSGP